MTQLRTSPWLAAIVLAGFAGCFGGETPTTEPAGTEGTAAAVPAPQDAPPPFDPSKAEVDRSLTLVPSPVETQKALEQAGIDTQLATLIPERKLDMTKADLDHVAVRSGVLLADMLLTVKSAKKEALAQHLSDIRTGMEQLQGGKDIDATLADVRERVNADSVSRDDLLKEFDELSGAVIPELEFNGNNRAVPLIQAGSWLEGANLVAKAVQASGKSDTGPADTLLKQPAVVDYFIDYVKNEGATKAPEGVTAKLEESLTTLKGLANKSEPLSKEDIAKVIEVTDAVLALL